MDQGLLAEFLAECGLDAPFRVEVFSHDDATTQLQEFRQPFLVIGQREGSDLRLEHWLVGRRHVYLQLIEGRFRCIDLGARTGTHGGDTTDRAGWVDPDRPLRIGPYLVRPVVPANAERPYPPLPIVTWSKQDRPESEPRWSMNRALILVGRSPFCEFRLPDSTVSRFHCGLVLTAKGVWVVDLLSQKPVLVNGRVVRFASVRPGDVLQVGPFGLTPHYDMSLIHAVRERADRTPFESMTRPIESPLIGTSRGDDLEGSSADQLPAVASSIILPGAFWEQDASGTLGVERFGSQELIVTALVQQFGAMQQQMFDQFHQMMMGMFERFAELHRETATSVRAEVDEVRKLSGEIESLRTETARLAEASTLAIQQTAFDRSSHHQSAIPPGPPALRPAPVANRPGSVPPAGPVPAPSPAAASAAPTGAARRPPIVPPPPSGDPPVDIHAQLCSRLNQMETERQGRWQKILAMMTTSRS